MEWLWNTLSRETYFVLLRSLHVHPRQCHVAKRYNKNLFFKSALLTPTVSTSAFHSTNLFLFSRHHIPTDNVALFSAYKPTNNP